VITQHIRNKVKLELDFPVSSIAKYINTLKVSDYTEFGEISAGDFRRSMKAVESAFFRLQRSEEERIAAIKELPKKKNHTFMINRVYVIQPFDELYMINKEYNTVSKLQLYAKAVTDRLAAVEIGFRKGQRG